MGPQGSRRAKAGISRGVAASWASSAGVRRSMQSNTPRTTKPETALRSALHQEGLRFRKHLRPVKGVRLEVDVAFPRLRLAVFVDGCFWHGCPDHATYPVTNAAWWTTKLANNRQRDVRFNQLLRENGWTVLRIWEHESTSDAVLRVRHALDQLESATVTAQSPG